MFNRKLKPQQDIVVIREVVNKSKRNANLSIDQTHSPILLKDSSVQSLGGMALSIHKSEMGDDIANKAEIRGQD